MTVELKGKHAEEFWKEVFKRPSPASIEKNQKAVKLLAQLRK